MILGVYQLVFLLVVVVVAAFVETTQLKERVLYVLKFIFYFFATIWILQQIKL